LANCHAHIELAPMYRTLPILTRSFKASMVSSTGVWGSKLGKAGGDVS
jgi:hypothetical protein